MALQNSANILQKADDSLLVIFLRLTDRFVIKSYISGCLKLLGLDLFYVNLFRKQLLLSRLLCSDLQNSWNLIELVPFCPGLRLIPLLNI